MKLHGAQPELKILVSSAEVWAEPPSLLVGVPRKRIYIRQGGQYECAYSLRVIPMYSLSITSFIYSL